MLRQASAACGRRSTRVFFALTVFAAFSTLAPSAKALDVTVAAPGNNALVSSPFSVQAASNTCSGQPVAAMGYSIDDSNQTQIYAGTSLNAMALASSGAHVIHIKSWGQGGSSCTQDLALTVISASSMPPNVTVANNLQRLASWVNNADGSISGSASGTSKLVASPSLSGQARQFSIGFQNFGGEIFHSSVGVDTSATNFVYDAQLWLSNTDGLGNVEMDLNQVMSNGQTVIYGVQCDGYSGTWDYTVNSGTPYLPIDTWLHSNVSCNPQTWATNTWHHIQIAYSRDNNGNVTYRSVSLDGVQSEFINASGNSAFALGWAPTLLTNFQIDGRGPAGAITAYLDNVTVYRW